MNIVFSPKQLEVIRAPFDHTLDANEGTPRSGKTTAGVFRFARYLIETDDISHLIVAYNQEQGYKLVIEGDGLGLRYIFAGASKLRHDDNGDHLEIRTPKGLRRVYYKGGGKADSHKAITGMSFGAVYFCEINLLHQNMIQECFRRTFAARMRWHLADLNPPAPQDPVIDQVFKVQHTCWRHWTVDDNPIIMSERKAELKATLAKNPYLYKRDWLGERVMPQGVIYAMFNHETHTCDRLKGEPVEMYFAGDGGQGDATSMGCYIVSRLDDRFVLSRAAAYYHSGKDTGQIKAMSVYAKELRVFIRWCRERWPNVRYGEIYIDPACKSLREEMHLLGIDTTGAPNNAHDVNGGKKGIEVGIERAQNLLTDGRFFLIDSDTYGHADFVREVGMYCRDDHGNPIDAYNHAMDEFRYASNVFYREYVL